MYGWVLNTDLWLWQAIEWVQFRIPIVAQARTANTAASEPAPPPLPLALRSLLQCAGHLSQLA